MVRSHARLTTVRAWLAVPAAAFVMAFFVVPVLRIIGRGLSSGALADLFTDRSIARVAWFTLWQATLSTMATLVLALPITFVIARTRFAGRSIVESLLVIPFVLPTVVVGAAYLALLPAQWKRSAVAIIIAHVFFNLAVVVKTVVPLWRQLDERQNDAAATLGASRFVVTRTIVWPQLRPAIGAAAAIVFLFTFTSFGIVQLLGGPGRRTLEVEIYRRTAQLLDLRGAAALAVVQLVALTAALAVASRSSASTNRVSGRLSTPRQTGLLGWVIVTITLSFLSAPLVALVQRAGQWHSVFDERSREALSRSAGTAAVAGAIATVLGMGAAMAIATKGRWQRLLDLAIVLPLGTSAVTIGFGLLLTYNDRWYDLRGSRVIVPIAHALIGLPFVVRTIVPVLASIEPRQRDAAATLGASPFHVFLTIEFPRIRRAVAAGFGFAAAVSIGEFGASSFLSRRSGPTLPILIGDLLGRPGAANRERAYALAVLLAVVTAALMLAVDRLTKDRSTDRPGRPLDAGAA